MSDIIAFNFYCLDCDCGSKQSSPITIKMTEEERDEGVICPNSEVAKLKCVGQKVFGGPKTTDWTNAKIKADRRRRSSNHFQKEILPTFNPKSMEGKHFNKKYKKKK